MPAGHPRIKKAYKVELHKGENGWIVVKVPGLPGVNTQGRTERKAIQNAREAVGLMVEELGLDREFTLRVN